MTPGAIAIRALIIGFIISFAVITGFAYTTLLERKVLARLQHRIGPNRAGYLPVPWRGGEKRFLSGFMQPAADAVKLFFKEDPTPAKVDRITYNLAPMLARLGPWRFEPYFAIAPGINVGVLFILAITSIGVYGIILAGWASNSKYAILGGIRASAQMISYELALGIIVLIPIMMANSMNLGDIVEAQRPIWFVFIQPLAAIVFFVAALAELQRAPFDLLEAEQELSAGFNVEYAGMRFGMFFMAEYMKMISLSAIFATFFLGGYGGPFVDRLPWLGFIYIILKIIACLFLMIWIRASLPRLRYDQLMGFGWKGLLPIAVLNFIITAVLIVMAEEGTFAPLLETIRGFFIG